LVRVVPNWRLKALPFVHALRGLCAVGIAIAVVSVHIRSDTREAVFRASRAVEARRRQAALHELSARDLEEAKSRRLTAGTRGGANVASDTDEARVDTGGRVEARRDRRANAAGDAQAGGGAIANTSLAHRRLKRAECGSRLGCSGASYALRGLIERVVAGRRWLAFPPEQAFGTFGAVCCVAKPVVAEILGRRAGHTDVSARRTEVAWRREAALLDPGSRDDAEAESRFLTAQTLGRPCEMQI
jgi:hypothetical protein